MKNVLVFVVAVFLTGTALAKPVKELSSVQSAINKLIGEPVEIIKTSGDLTATTYSVKWSPDDVVNTTCYALVKVEQNTASIVEKRCR